MAVALDAQEVRQFRQYGQLDEWVLDIHSTAPTALHSWGGQVRPWVTLGWNPKEFCCFGQVRLFC